MQLEKMNNRLDMIDAKLALVARKLSENTKPPFPVTDNVLLELKDNERKYFLALLNAGEADAGLIALDTDCERANASHALNDLVSRGYVRKRRDKKRILFSINPEVRPHGK